MDFSNYFFLLLQNLLLFICSYVPNQLYSKTNQQKAIKKFKTEFWKKLEVITY